MSQRKCAGARSTQARTTTERPWHPGRPERPFTSGIGVILGLYWGYMETTTRGYGSVCVPARRPGAHSV